MFRPDGGGRLRGPDASAERSPAALNPSPEPRPRRGRQRALRGASALIAGRPFLTGLWYAKPIPGIGKISTVLTFDIGVYLVVLGVLLTLVFSLGEEE